MIEWWFIGLLVFLILALKDEVRNLITMFSLGIPWYIFGGWKGFGIGIATVFLTSMIDVIFFESNTDELPEEDS